MLRAVARSTMLSLVRQRVHPPTLLRPALACSRPFSSEDKQQSTASESASTTDSETTTTTSTPDTPADEVQALQKALADKDEQIAELNDRALRALAEMENVRTIARRDVDNAKKFAIVPFVRDVLSVADNLSLALANSPDPEAPLHAGVAATDAQLIKVFSSYGISRYGDVGDTFDPNKHQAMFEAPTPDHPPGTIISVQKQGYEMEERVLRPAEVGVAKAP